MSNVLSTKCLDKSVNLDYKRVGWGQTRFDLYPKPHIPFSNGGTAVDKLSTFFTLMAAMSIAVERVVEIVKGIFPSLATTQTDARMERRRHMTLQLLAAIAGVAVAAVTQASLNKILGEFLKPATDVWTLSNLSVMTAKYSLIGVMVSGGSAMWNHALDIVGAIKIKQEK